MANIEKVSGVFGGIKTDEPIQNCGNNGIGIENAININGENTINNSSTGTNLPAKNTFWNKVKSVLFYDIKVELTPYEQKVEDEVNEFLHQEVTWTKVKNFLFQEVTFGKKKNLQNEIIKKGKNSKKDLLFFMFQSKIQSSKKGIIPKREGIATKIRLEPQERKEKI